MSSTSKYTLQGQIDFQGLNIMVENRKGSVRKGTNDKGVEWKTKMKYPYGYISRTKAADNEHVDCYVGDNRDSDKVFVVHQVNPDTKEYDEDKVMLGFDNANAAKAAYLDHYDSPDFFGSMIQMTFDRFKESLKENKGKKLQKALDIVMKTNNVVDQDKLKKALDIIDLIKGGKGLPIGTIKTHGDGITRIKVVNGWRPYKGSAQGHKPDKIDTVDKIIEVSKMNIKDPHAKLLKLIEGGVHDPELLVDATHIDRSTIIAKLHAQGITPVNSTLNKDSVRKHLDKPPVKARWDSYELFLDMVAGGLAKSAIAYGTGGVGKTFRLQKIFDKHGMTEFDQDEHITGSPDYEYVKITGKATPTAMYRALYEHNGKTIVFDDCDSVLKDETSVNILKGALDSTGKGTVSYLSGKPIKDADGEPLPQRFNFEGKAIFISNLEAKDMPQPLRSRALTIDLTMTADETIEVMRDIVQKIPLQDNMGNPIDVSKEDRTAAIDFLDSVKDKISIGDLNARTLGQIALIKKKVSASATGLDWKIAATAMLS